MKTLDEVIEKIEKMWVCPSSDEDAEYCDFMEVKEDALHYLKVFRAEREHLVELHRELVKENDNNPLTWDELKQMEGKPVWMEWISGTWKGLHKWVISHGCDDMMMVFTALDIAGASYDGHLWQINLGKTWQAYRKER